MKYDHFLQHVCPDLGLNWRKYRRKEARRGVFARMAELGLYSFEAYIQYLRLHPEEGEHLPDIMNITVTRFHRDSRCWERLVKVLPELVTSGRKPRVLSAGCCGGEEPYTLAIVWKELFEERFGPIEILAVDMDKASLTRARKAIYDKWSLRELPDIWLNKWFTPSGGQSRLSQEITRMVHFEHRHLFHEPLHGLFDLILCRYLIFTYFTDDRRFEASLRLWQVLRDTGAFMIGEKEGLGTRELQLFKPSHGTRCIFRKNRMENNSHHNSCF